MCIRDSSLSTAIGYAAASSKLNFIIIGDLSFFYDMNALWNQNYGANTVSYTHLDVYKRQSLLLFDILFPTFAINFKINKKLNRTDAQHVI